MPYLKRADNGALQVWSSRYGIGRHKWEQTVTIVYRNGTYLVAGFTHQYFDSLDPEAGGHCDVNYLTRQMSYSLQGHVVKNAPITIGAQVLGSWQAADIPPQCNL